MNVVKIKAYYDSPEYLEKLQARANNVRLLAADPLARGRMIADVYCVDFERFCEDFLFIIMPEFGDAIKPFFLFEYQKKIIRKVQDSEMGMQGMELLVDKPRGMGLTWLLSAYIYWRWLFTPNWSGLILSRTETEVDDGTASPSNSIFSKIRWLIARTPKWMLPGGFEPKGKKGTSTDSSLRLINPVMNSVIAGSSTNSNAGRGRRYSFSLIDECFSVDRFNEVYRALQSVSRINVFISTTKASATARRFKDMCELAGNYISLTWRDHPFKDDEWYQDQLRKAEFDPEVMKEVDVSYSVSERMQYYPQIKEAKIVRIDYNPSLPVYSFLDFGKNDLTVIGWAQFSGNQINILECYANNGKGKVEWYAPFMNPEHQLDPSFAYSEMTLQFLNKVRAWKKPMAFFGERAHTIKSMADNRSIADVLARCGIRILVNNYAVEYEPRRKATSQLLPKMVFNESSDGAMKLYDAIANSRYKNSESSKNNSMEPVHDNEIADYRAALENLCVNIGRVFKHQRNDVGESLKVGGFAKNLIQYLRV